MSPSPSTLARLCPLLVLAAGLTACTTNNPLQGDKVDYKTSGSKTVSLEVPPDLSQLARDTRYQPADGTISASSLQAASASAPAAAPAVQAVAPSEVGDVRLERAGSQRWISTSQTPEQLWPQLEAFWQENGLALDVENRQTGVMETVWAENRAKLPQDFIRRTLGRVIDFAYDTSQRDRYRTRLERAPDGRTEIYITHRGMEEVYTSARQDSTMWQPAPPDPGLEAVMLTKLMQKLGGKELQAKAADAAASAAAVSSAAAPATVAHARLVDAPPAGSAVQMDDGFDRAWRRVGLALDRSGFTVEDRDRAQGLYYVRYVDPKQANKAEPGFFSKLFGSDDSKAKLARYRIAVKSQAESTLVTVQNDEGAPETGATAKRILQLLVADLR